MTQKTAKPTAALVAFVAAGPGDPELLTLRAADLLAAADVVVAEEGVAELFARHINPGAEAQLPLDAEGKALSAAGRGKLLADLSKAGRRVVRLFAGDPILDGTLVAEATTVAKAHLPFELVPGVSPAIGGAAYAGFALVGGSSRNVAVVDVEAHKGEWAAFADPAQALVLVNPHGKLLAAVKGLLEAGRAEETPVLVLRHGTTVEQESTVTTLGEVTTNARASVGLGEGTIVYVGETVTQRDSLNWFEHRPLLGWKVLVPRTKDDVVGIAETLTRLGAVTVEVPTISVEPPRTPQQMERAVQGMVSGRYEWVAFTSPHAVRAVAEKLAEYGLDARSLAGMKIAAVGTDTTDALQAMGVRADLTPEEGDTTAALLDVWPQFETREDPINRVFLPRADIATEALTEGLVKLGWEVEEVTAYRTVRAAPPAAHIRDAIKSGGYDAVLFTSASTVRNLVGIAGKPHASTVIACIGPQTAQTAQEHGLRVDVLSATPDVPSLISALAEHAGVLRDEAQDPLWRPSRRKAGARRKAN